MSLRVVGPLFGESRFHSDVYDDERRLAHIQWVYPFQTEETQSVVRAIERDTYTDEIKETT